MRIDVYLTQNGFCESRSRASRLISEGSVKLDGRVVQKPSEEIDDAVCHSVEINTTDELVGRGGQKLYGALEHFNIDVTGMRCIDVGASTGGFTQCLLNSGATSVLALDSGRDQLHKSLREDARVTSVEGYNARNLGDEFGIFDCAVMDVSFISQTLIIDALSKVIRDGGILVSLIKPQFEAGRQAIGKGGIVKNPSDREKAIYRVLDSARACGLSLEGIMRSPIKGGDGNIEFLAYFKKADSGVRSDTLGTLIKELCKGK